MDTLEETLSEHDEGQGEYLIQDSSEVETSPKVIGRNGKPLPPSHQPFDTKGYTSFQRKSLESKREYLKGQWLDIAYIVLDKAKSMSRGMTKKDYGKLVQLLMSAGISWDKVFPKDMPASGNNLVLNLFNGLPQGKVLRVIGEQPVPSGEPLLTPLEETLPKG